MKTPRFFSYRWRRFRVLSGSWTILLLGVISARASDILRGGGPANSSPQTNAASGVSTATMAQARSNAKDTLARTSQAIQAVKAMQTSARALALGRPSTVPNGLVVGGLQVAPKVPINLANPQAGEDATLWIGAKLPTTSTAAGRTVVTVEQQKQQALLNWKTFNVGRETTVKFDQSAAGTNVNQWIAINKINDPSGQPSQILGAIEAPGQVYLINQNGILFGGSAQINLHTLVASSLPINDNLVARGLLNNPDDQFLFSSLVVPKLATGGTLPAFTPPAPPAILGGRLGDIVVEPGAILSSPTSAEHIGGRIALVGPNVVNGGTIQTPDGQTILAAGLQVGMAAHASKDPSLRGLDVFIGKVVDSALPSLIYAGRATNRGLIDAPRASVILAGQNVDQMGVISGTTSASLNGRFDLLANYGAVPLILQSIVNLYPTDSGIVTFGARSVSQILPETGSDEKVVGKELAVNSLINVQGKAIHLAARATVFAPSARLPTSSVSPLDASGTTLPAGVTFNAGSWLPANGTFSFTLSQGQIYLDGGAEINVAGLTDVPASVTDNIVAVQLRGFELRDSPLQRSSALRGQTIQIDAAVGTPLADAQGYIDLIAHSVGQLSINGGTVQLFAGESVIVQKGATVDTSGGFIHYAGGMVQTTRLISAGVVYDISQATPDRIYDGIYTGNFSVEHPKFGLTETYTNPFLLAQHYAASYDQGGNGGTLAISAPSVALDGNFRASTLQGEKQRSSPPTGSTLNLRLQGQASTITPLLFPFYSPTPPRITVSDIALSPANPFALDASGNPRVLRADRQAAIHLSPSLLGSEGYANLTITNSDGDFELPAKATIETPMAGSFTVSASNVDVQGRIRSPSGKISFTVYDVTPTPLIVYQTAPAENPNRGSFTLGASASLDASGMILDDRKANNPSAFGSPAIAGGSISIASYRVLLQPGSVADVSGGALVSSASKVSYGPGGSLSIAGGQDPRFGPPFGGILQLDAELRGYSGAQGGSLSLLAPGIQIGGSSVTPNALSLSPDFFNQGGFSSFRLTGLGAVIHFPDTFYPAVVIASGTLIRPEAQSWVASLGSPLGSDVDLRPTLLPDFKRAPVSLSLNAPGVKDPIDTNRLLVRGDLIMGAGAEIQLTPHVEGAVSISGQTVALLGSVNVPGGTISVSGASQNPIVASQALPTLDLGPMSTLSVAGASVQFLDGRGLRSGQVLAGGKIYLSGNIVARKGSVLDISGATGVFDLAPAYDLASAAPTPLLVGLRGGFAGNLTVPTIEESDAGTINLGGGQILVTNAQLVGKAGGPSAEGGKLFVGSDRFSVDPPSPTDPTLIVTQISPQLASTPAGESLLGKAVRDSSGATIASLGHFGIENFIGSGIDSLTLYGTIVFQGPVAIDAARSLRIAAARGATSIDGGIISSDSTVRLSAPYVYLGKSFTDPRPAVKQDFPYVVNGSNRFDVPPSFGPGKLTVSGDLIDVGNLSLRNIGVTSFDASHGDIRGVGTLDVAGSLTLRAGQIYAPTASRFDIIARNAPGVTGSITILPGVQRPLPLSAGSTLYLGASTITQNGTLVAPLGTIILGSDPTYLDPITRSVANPTLQLTLGPGSLTSVSAIDPVSGKALVIPYGLILNGDSWIDPFGTDITLTGLPGKAIRLSADRIDDLTGSNVDLRGGGDLYAYRFVSGLGGSTDLLASGVTPKTFAILPGYAAHYAPFAPFSDRPLTNFLGGDTGYVSSSLQVGDRVFLQASPGLAEGFYTLLPARYALLSGAFLVTPKTGLPLASTTLPDGSVLTSGYRVNGNVTRGSLPLAVRFEVDSSAVVRSRAEYNDSFANTFIPAAAKKHDTRSVRLPVDAGQLVFSANTALQIEGTVLAQAAPGGRGGLIDISSAGNIFIAGPSASPPPLSLVLDSANLSTFGAESLLIGGFRTVTNAGTVVNVRANNLIVDNAGAPLTGSDVILVSKNQLEIRDGSTIEQTPGTSLTGTDPLLFGTAGATGTGSGNGNLLRVSADPAAQINRFDVVPGGSVTTKIGTNVLLAGNALILDTTGLTQLGAGTMLQTSALSLGSGHISLLVSQPASLTLPNPLTQLVLSSDALTELQTSLQSFSLLSYSSLDLYGDGTVGSSALANLAIHAAEIRGYATSPNAEIHLQAQAITLDNPTNRTTTLVNNPLAGDLILDSSTISLGAGNVAITGFSQADLRAAQFVNFTGTGALTFQGSATLTTPLLTGSGGAKEKITASGGALTVQAPSGGPGGAVGSGFGASLTLEGQSVDIETNLRLPSGSITLHATGASGDVRIGDLSSSVLDVSGRSVAFFDLTRSTPGGTIAITSDHGSIEIATSAALSVRSAPDAGDAGTLQVSAAEGTFSLSGSLSGQGNGSGESGHFSLDVGALDDATGSLSSLNGQLNQAGFFEDRSFRVRQGDILVDGTGGQTAMAHSFSLSADQGKITVSGLIDASGSASSNHTTGGAIFLAGAAGIELTDGAILDASGASLDAAGKAGTIDLETTAGRIAIAAGSHIDLRIAGQTGGELHLRAPQNGAVSDLAIDPIAGVILGESSVVAEGFFVQNATVSGASIDDFLTAARGNATSFMTNAPAIATRLAAGNTDLALLLHIRPGEEIDNTQGDLTLNADLDLSTWRFGATKKSTNAFGILIDVGTEPGVLTLRASGSILFLGSLSDGFGDGVGTPAFDDQGNAALWMQPLLPTFVDGSSQESWSFRITAGADLSASDWHAVTPVSDSTSDSGSVMIGKFTTASAFPGGPDTTTSSVIRDSSGTSYYQVIRTGTGDIDISAKADVQFLNQFATIYTAGAQSGDPTLAGTFDVPILFTDEDGFFPGYPAQYSLGGGNVRISALRDIVHYTFGNQPDSEQQLPTNWLYRRGYVDGSGQFGIANFGDVASTSWWIDFSNFFEGVGALGGGNVQLLAGRNVSNVDAAAPTNMRVSKDGSAVTEQGGGNVEVTAGNNIDAGVYYVERGRGTLRAGGEITTNATRTAFTVFQLGQNPVGGPTSWLPTTLFLGKGSWNLLANGNIVLGPVANPILLPGGQGNSIWYKTYFSTYAPDSKVEASSLDGSVTLRAEVALPVSASVGSIPFLQAWYGNVLNFNVNTVTTESVFRPWLRLNETDILPFRTLTALMPGTLRLASFADDINLIGRIVLSPAPEGSLDLLTTRSINGVQLVGTTRFGSSLTNYWQPSSLNLSDADPNALPGIYSPQAFQLFARNIPSLARNTDPFFLTNLDAYFNETLAAPTVLQTKQALHDGSILHRDDLDPVHFYALEGDISGFTLFSAKPAHIAAGRDVTDIGFYIQNVREEDITVIAAGRDIIAYNTNSLLRGQALAPGNILQNSFYYIKDPFANSGDIQIGGPGTLEVLAGRNLDLGIGPVISSGFGITTVGQARNPALPFTGAQVVAAAGLGPVTSLDRSDLGWADFISSFVETPQGALYLRQILGEQAATMGTDDYASLPPETQDLLALQVFYLVLRDAGRHHNDPASPGYQNYDTGFAAISALFGESQNTGDISLTAREIKTRSGGDISLLAPHGKLTVGFQVAGTQPLDQGILTEDGGNISIFTEGNVDVGTSRIFTLRGGNEIIWSSKGNIAAGASSKTVQSAPPTRVIVDPQSGNVQTDLAGLATGGGIGVLLSVAGVAPGDVDLIAPAGVVDAGDAGIRVSRNLNISAVQVLNASNIQVTGTSAGTPTVTVSAPNLSLLTTTSNTIGSSASNAQDLARTRAPSQTTTQDIPSIITVEVVGYGGSSEAAMEDQQKEEEKRRRKENQL